MNFDANSAEFCAEIKDILDKKAADIISDYKDACAADSTEDVVVEVALLKRTSASDKLANKKKYRLNRAKKKLEGAKYRRSAVGKKTARIAKKMKKLGKTSTGKRIVRRS